jgi:hypothetical protein
MNSKRDDELEVLRQQLAACGVAAMSNTKETAARRITPDSLYYSASYGDVCAAVDREMALRDEADQRVREFIGWLSGDIPELHAVEVPKLIDSWERFLVHRIMTKPEVQNKGNRKPCADPLDRTIDAY